MHFMTESSGSWVSRFIYTLGVRKLDHVTTLPHGESPQTTLPTSRKLYHVFTFGIWVPNRRGRCNNLRGGKYPDTIFSGVKLIAFFRTPGC